METINVSVIIPVYNTEKYIDKCLESVINQSLKSIEIICIDDCSTDSSRDIIKKYSETDSRISLIVSSTNDGVGASRNKGIDYAKGEYLFFLDSDDYIDSDTLEYYYTKIYQNKLDYAMFSDAVCEEREDNIITGIELMKYLCVNTIVFGLRGLYNRNFLFFNNIRFNGKSRYCEDHLFTLMVLTCAKRCIKIQDFRYHPVVHEDSLTTTEMNRDKIESSIFSLYKMLEYRAKSADFIYEFVRFKLVLKTYEVILDEIKKSKKIDVLSIEYGDEYDSLFGREIKLYDELRSFYEFSINNHYEICFYGAGKIAKQYINSIEEMGGTISKVFVTKIELKNKFFGFDIIPIDNYRFDNTKDFILISTGEKHRQGIITILKSKNISNYAWFDPYKKRIVYSFEESR